MWARVVAVGSAILIVALAAVLVAVAQGGADQLAARGKELFKEHGCYGCHTVEKFGTPIATDLSHVGSKHNRDYLTRWLRDPASQKPTAHMPKIAMSKMDADALAAYLASLR